MPEGVAEEHDCRGRPRPHGRQPAGNELARPLGERRWQRPRGRHRSADLHDQLYLDRCVQRQDGDADRAAGMLPAVAEYLAQQLARPVDDCGWPVNVGTDETKPTSLTTRVIADRSPTCDRTAARALRAHCRAHSYASSGLTSAPTLPV